MRLSRLAPFVVTLAIGGALSVVLSFAALYLLFAVYVFPPEPLEGNFWLYSGPRLPAWVRLPAGVSKDDVAMEISYYDAGRARFEVRRRTIAAPTGGELLQRELGTYRWHPVTSAKAEGRGGWDFYPQYAIVTIGGVDEILEKRRREERVWLVEQPPDSLSGEPKSPGETDSPER